MKIKNTSPTLNESSFLEFSLCGKDWRIERPADLESLWNTLDQEEFTEDERLPYWVELWPSSLALASWLQSQSRYISGKKCLDLGCGLGFTALVGALEDAHVVAMDYEPEALMYAKRNALWNEVNQPLWVAMDWRFPSVIKGCFDFIWAGDIMYEKRFVSPIISFLSYTLAPKGRMWLAEPGRNIYEDFNGALRQNGWVSQCVNQERVVALDGVPVSANIWEIQRASAVG